MNILAGLGALVTVLALVMLFVGILPTIFIEKGKTEKVLRRYVPPDITTARYVALQLDMLCDGNMTRGCSGDTMSC